ncbi:MAG: hypothetical protein FWE25_00935 [Lachnospiraceae bacterium]|nr:hypothetical protein [Lachnospiraceae bacterium]
MDIGIKYCGGCNPRYDRTSIVVRLEKDFPGLQITSAAALQLYDIVVFLKGCMRPCIKEEDYPARIAQMIVSCEADYLHLYQVIYSSKKGGRK